jgi:hypothetical protein
MANTSIKYIVYSHSGGGVRHHHFGTQNNIINEANGQAAKDDVINALGIPSLPFNGSNLPFAFMSVHGGADGNQLYTSPGNQTVKVGTNNIDILVVYAPVGGIGGPGGGPGVWVDAFNVDAGNFSDSDFIQVLAPPTPPDTVDNLKTTEANVQGDVSSVAAENLRAFATVDGAPFLEWKNILPAPSIVASRDLQLTQNESGEIWFAFYQTIPVDQSLGKLAGRILEDLKNLREVVDLNFMPRWVVDDWCGTPWPHHFGHAGQNFQLSIKPELINALPAAQRDQLQSYVKQYTALANSAYGDLSKVSAMLKGVIDLLSQVKSK